MTATAQFAQQPLYTYHSRADVAFVGGDDGGYGILGYLFDVIFRNQSESKWQDIGGDCIVAVIDAVRIQRVSRHGRRSLFDMQETGVEGILHAVFQLFPFFRISL